MEYCTKYHFKWKCKACGYPNRVERGYDKTCLYCGCRFNEYEQPADITKKITGDRKWESRTCSERRSSQRKLRQK